MPLALLTHDALLSSHGARREITDNQHDEYYRYKAPLPEDAQDGDTVDIQLSDAKAFTKKDFMIELEDDLEHHKGNMADYRAILLILLFFGPFYLITAQSVMFASQPWRLSALRGNPSMRKFREPLASMAWRMSASLRRGAASPDARGGTRGRTRPYARDLDGDDLALLDEVVDELAVLARRVLALGAQQVAGAEVHPAVLVDDPRAHGALAAARAAEDEDDAELRAFLLEAVDDRVHDRGHGRGDDVERWSAADARLGGW